MFDDKQPVVYSNFNSAPKTTTFYVIITENFSTIDEQLVILASRNTITKYIFLLTNGTLKDGTALLKTAWEKFKMMKIIVIIPENDHMNPYEVDHYMMVQNPFKFNEFGLRGEIHIFAINSTNYRENTDMVLKIINDQDKNLFQYPVKVYMYEWPIYSKAIFNRSNSHQVIRYTLLDGEILNILSTKMNFKSEFVGKVSENNVMGSVMAVNEMEADIAANSLIISDYKTDNAVFLASIGTTELAYIVPKMQSLKTLNVFIYSLFDVPSEIIMILVFVLLVVVWYVLNFIYEQFTRRPEGNSIPRSLLIIASTQYFISIKFTKFIKGHQQILLGVMLIYGIIVSSIYQSSVIIQLSSRISEKDTNSLNELFESNLKIYFVPTLKDFVNQSLTELNHSSIYYRLFSKQLIMHNQLELVIQEIAIDKTAALLCSEKVAREITYTIYDSKSGDDLIYVVPESPGHFFKSLLVPKQSPYRVTWNLILGRCLEGGILNYELMRTELLIRLKYITRAKLNLQTGDTIFRPISPDQMRSLFMVWVFMLIVSMIVFAIEVLTYRFYRVGVVEF